MKKNMQSKKDKYCESWTFQPKGKWKEVVQLPRPKFCQLEALRQKLPRAFYSMCVQTMLYVHARYIYSPRPYKRKLRGSFYVFLQRM